MKLKSTLLVVSGLLAGVLYSNAASMLVINIDGGPGDTLYAKKDNSLLNGGLVTMGYFSSTVTPGDVSTIAGLVANLVNYTMVTSAVPGSVSTILGTANPGYVDQVGATTLAGGLVTSGTGNASLIGRVVYSIITDASSLSSGTMSSQWALLSVGILKDDVPFEGSYNSNPAGLTPLIGSLGTYSGDAGAGAGTYKTLRMDVVPEASTALLGALGALGLLRRRR